MPSRVIFVHGYSVRSLSTYGGMPKVLLANGFRPQDIFLSAYDSLNDDITCDDLARALELRVRGLESAGLNMQDTAIIAHSTGAIITRRWMLNRWAAGQNLPSHLISLAGANHGSTLAQLGETQMAYLYRELNGGTSVGREVLQDLDYGSAFLLKLNEDWLDAYLAKAPPAKAPPAKAPPKTFAFSLIGDDHSALTNQIFWQSKERGSDSTVRISGGNLNYRIMSFDQTGPRTLTIKALSQNVPHLVLAGVSHTGDNGILGGAKTLDIVSKAILAALAVRDTTSYLALEMQWAEQTAAWNASNTDDCNATILFALTHPGGRNVEDSLILIKDGNPGETASIMNVSGAIEPHQPIQNDILPSSVSFYVNHKKFSETYPHSVNITVNSGCPEITYPAASYLVKTGDAAAIRQNEFVYVKVTLDRQPVGTYSVVRPAPDMDITKTWPPLPESV